MADRGASTSFQSIEFHLPEWRLVAWVSALLMGLLFVPQVRATMFVPPKSVASKIHIDGKGFVIDGRRVFVVSGSLHYPRVPRAMWANRMEKMKRAGYNCLSTYIFWNYQEPREGQFNFRGRHNIVAFVKLAQKMGFYVILRIGPWDCAEWDSGGYPVWLRFIPGLSVRHGDAPYIAALRQYYHKLLPQLIPLQVTHGGPVIMMQLDNEDPQGWGAVLPNNYYKYLYHECMKFGVDVPLFFSGQHHGPDPAGTHPFNHAQASAPWFTTEMWSGWFTQYGEWPAGSQQRVRMMRAPWDVIADGGAGYNVYMTIGGTNFSHWNNQSNQASYDFGSPVGQGGNLRPSYYNYKLANYFGRSFQSVLADSVNVSGHYRNFAPGAQIAARRSPAGTIVFLRNFSRQPKTVKAKIGGSVYLPANRTVPLILNYKLNSRFHIAALCGRVFGYFQQKPDVSTLIMYGTPGTTGLAKIVVSGPRKTVASAGWTTPKPGMCSINIKFPSANPQIYNILNGKHVLHLIVMSNTMAHDTWVITKGGKCFIVMGPQFIGHAQLAQGHLIMHIQRPMDPKHQAVRVELLPPDGVPAVQVVNFAKSAPPTAPALAQWQWRVDDGPASPAFNDANWLSCVNPRQMGADDYPGAYEWYRSQMSVPVAGTYILELPGISNYAEVFINGHMRFICGSGLHDLHLNKGKKTLAIFTVNEGRNKMWGYAGPLAPVFKKGLFGPIYLKRQEMQTRWLATWRFKQVPSPVANIVANVLSNEPGHKGWGNFKSGSLLPAAKKGYWWLRTLTGKIAANSLRVYLPYLPPGVMLFVDGHQLTLSKGAQGNLHTVMREGWHHGNRKNRIDLLIPVQSKAVKLITRFRIVTKYRAPGFGKTGRITSWKMHGGIGPVDPKTGWKDGSVATGVPTFYKSSFVINKLSGGLHRVLRVAMTNMGGGYVWINGHNLGRYPDHIMPLGLYIPSAWMHAGRNSIIVFDEQGHSPAQIHLSVYASACRQHLTIALPMQG